MAETPAGLVGADWIVSAVTADQSLEAVEALAPHLVQGQLVIDINSVSPERKRATAALVVETAAAGYLDMAVMAPVHPHGHRTPVLVAGPVVPDLGRLGFEHRVVGDAPGAATAIKMVRSLFVKGLEAITVETLLAAEASGCFEEILTSLSGAFRRSAGRSSRTTSSSARCGTAHGGRRRCGRSATTLQALGLQGALAGEIAEVHARMGASGGKPAAELRATVAETLRRRR